MEAVFDRFGVDVNEQRDHWIIHPSDHMQVEHFPHLASSGMTLTFDRATALTREEFVYLSWDHPMVTAAMDLILDEGFGQADCQVVRVNELPKGLAFVEASYVMQCTADAKLNIDRTCRRVYKAGPWASTEMTTPNCWYLSNSIASSNATTEMPCARWL